MADYLGGVLLLSRLDGVAGLDCEVDFGVWIGSGGGGVVECDGVVGVAACGIGEDVLEGVVFEFEYLDAVLGSADCYL